MQSPIFEHSLKQSVLAIALLQAFAAHAQTLAADQPMAEVVVSATRWTASDRASVAGFSNRPLLQTADPRRKLEELMAQREPLYRSIADLVIDTGRPNVQSMVQTILDQLDALEAGRTRRAKAASMNGQAHINLNVELGERSYPIAIGPGGRLFLDDASDSVSLHVVSSYLMDTVSWSTALAPGSSFNRNPDGTAGAPLSSHGTLSALPSSAGRRVDGSVF